MNRATSNPKVNEYLDAYHGEGIQHIACFTDDIYTTVEQMRTAGVEFLDTPETYFEVIDLRIPGHGKDVERLARNKILIDADPETGKRKLLQIFRPCLKVSSAARCGAGCCDGCLHALYDGIWQYLCQ